MSRGLKDNTAGVEKNVFITINVVLFITELLPYNRQFDDDVTPPRGRCV